MKFENYEELIEGTAESKISACDKIIKTSELALEKLEHAKYYFVMGEEEIKSIQIPENFKIENMGDKKYIIYDPLKVEIDYINDFELDKEKTNFIKVNGLKCLNVNLDTDTTLPSKIYFIRPRLNELTETNVDGVELSTCKTENDIYREKIIVGNLHFVVSFNILSDLPRANKPFNGFTLEIIDMVRIQTNNGPTNWEGKNPDLANTNLIQSVKKAIRQIRELGFKHIKTEATDERRKRVYVKLGMQKTDQNPDSKILTLNLDEVSGI